MLLLDTCALLWWTSDAPLAPDALKAMKQAGARGELFLSPVSAWEIGMLARRARLQLDVGAEVYVSTVFTRPDVQIAALSPEIAVRAAFLPGEFYSDPADRILVSTAMVMGLTLVTRDRRILDYARQGYVSGMAC